MPKVVVTPSKGLVQQSGSGVDLTATTLVARPAVTTISASTTLTQAQSGGVFLVGTDALTITLPATVAGVTYTFINSGADGAVLITVSPNSADAIYGTIANAAADSVMAGSDDGDLTNTKATANKGDRCTIVGDGSAGWYVADGVGIWVGA